MSMDSNKKRLVLPGILLGILILVLSVVFKSSSSTQVSVDNARLVSVQALVKVPSAPSVMAFGYVQPKNSWQAIAEVSGKIIFRHPELESGRFLKAGTLVLEVDPFEYELKQAQAVANIDATKAQLTRLDQQQNNLKASLQIEQEKLKLVDQEYQRKLVLKNKNLISNSDLESQKQTLLIQKKLVQDLSSELTLIPDDKKVTTAQLKVNEALLSDAQRQLANTHFTLPFDARISDVNVNNTQAISIGNVLFEADKLGMVEVEAQLSLQDAEMLMASASLVPLLGEALPNVDQLGFKATIAIELGNKSYQWPAKLTRIAESINVEQATIGFYLAVKQDANQLDFGANPPLSKGMFVSVSINGFPSEQFLIPEKALHGDQIYVMDTNKKLSIRPVNVNFRNKKGVAISGDIKQGEWLVLNDLIPAIEGMSLKVNENTIKKNEGLTVD